jgi:hypothetical protein
MTVNSPTSSWHETLSIHPAAADFPRMSPDEFKALTEDIKANGQRQPIAIIEKARRRPDGTLHVKDPPAEEVLDGISRLDAMEAAGLQVVDNGQLHKQVLRTVVDTDEVDPVAYVISANIHRRHLHLTAEQRRNLIAELLKATPEKSDRQIAETVKASPTTVGTVRAEIASTVQSGQLPAKRFGADGKRRRPPSPKKYAVNPAAAALFANEDQLHAFAGVVNLKTVRKFVTHDQQVDLAKHLTEGNIRAAAYQSWVSEWLRQAGKLQGRIDAKERDDFYKEFPGHEIRDEVAAVKSAARALVDPLLKLEGLWKKLPHHPFFGDLGSTLDDVIGMIRQYRRTAGERSADKVERDLARLHELEDKARKLKDANEGLRSELEETKATTRSACDDIGPDSTAEAERLRVCVEELQAEKRRLEIKIVGLESETEELRGKLATGTGGAMSFPEFQKAIKEWEGTVEAHKKIIRDLQNENANLRAGVGPPAADDGEMPPIPGFLDRTKQGVAP